MHRVAAVVDAPRGDLPRFLPGSILRRKTLGKGDMLPQLKDVKKISSQISGTILGLKTEKPKISLPFGYAEGGILGRGMGHNHHGSHRFNDMVQDPDIQLFAEMVDRYRAGNSFLRSSAGHTRNSRLAFLSSNFRSRCLPHQLGLL